MLVSSPVVFACLFFKAGVEAAAVALDVVDVLPTLPVFASVGDLAVFCAAGPSAAPVASLGVAAAVVLVSLAVMVTPLAAPGRGAAA